MRRNARGQSTVEYLLMVAFGAVFAIKIAQFFNGVVKEGLGPDNGLERTITDETASGERFR